MKLHIGSFPKLASGATLPLSRAVRCGPFLFLSGQLGLDEAGRLVAGGIAEQTRQALKAIEQTLADAGAGMDEIVKATVWLTDAADFPAFNEIYRGCFAQSPPARSTVVSALVIPGARVEIEVMAYVGA